MYARTCLHPRGGGWGGRSVPQPQSHIVFALASSVSFDESWEEKKKTFPGRTNFNKQLDPPPAKFSDRIDTLLFDNEPAQAASLSLSMYIYIYIYTYRLMLGWWSELGIWALQCGFKKLLPSQSHKFTIEIM